MIRPPAETQASLGARVRAWRVLQACESAADVAELTEAQLAVGMHPQVLAREFWSGGKVSASASLMTAWHAVRDWRHALNEAESLTSFQLVHAHSFVAAMASVRGGSPSVYDFDQTLEETMQSGAVAGPWMLRSFRVAEQFALSRASAVVTHTRSMAKVAHERGAAAGSVFVVPEPMETRRIIADRQWAALHGIDLGYHAVLFALPSCDGIEPALRAFASVLIEMEQAVLVFEFGNADRERLLRLARELEVADNIRCIATDEQDQALACADVVLTEPKGDDRRVNDGMLRAMAAGKAVVAADVEENRECSPDGRGVIWYRAGDIQDLAQRASFVARNADFSRALGESGQIHVRNTCSRDVVGRMYDEVYRYAQSRRSDNLPKIGVPKLYTANVQI